MTFSPVGLDRAWTTKRTTMDHPDGPAKGPPLDQGGPPGDGAPLVRTHGHMSTAKKTFIAVATAAAFLAAATGCSGGPTCPGTVISDEERAAFEASNFGTTPPPQATEDLSTSTAPVSALAQALLHPADWKDLAHGKLCEYTSALIKDADSSGTIISEKGRAAAKRILDSC